jgi:hypothetical protein
VEIIKCIRKNYPEQFQWKQPPYEYESKKLPIEILLGGPLDQFFGDVVKAASTTNLPAQ